MIAESEDVGCPVMRVVLDLVMRVSTVMGRRVVMSRLKRVVMSRLKRIVLPTLMISPGAMLFRIVNVVVRRVSRSVVVRRVSRSNIMRRIWVVVIDGCTISSISW
jgi:hypothetical protein